MLKILSLLCALSFAPLANGRAFSLNCGSPLGFKSDGRSLEVKTQGRWEGLGFGHARLNYELSFGVDCQIDGSCFAKAKSSDAGVVANRDYRPTRYHGYQQFALDFRPVVEQGYLLLPEMAPAEAGSFRAYLQLVGVQGSYGATVPLLCQGEPVNSFGSSASENAPAEIARANRIIQEDYGFKNLRLRADGEALQKQIDAARADTVSVSQATQLAMAQILDDFGAIEAPLNIAANGWALTHEQKISGDLNQDQKLEARRFLREQMQGPKTTLSLFLGTTIKGENYPPEQGESTEDKWIFVLHVPNLSDHLYWVIIDRQGKEAPYLYGFN